MTLQQLKYFIEVAGAGSISAAARRLYLAQPSLSAAMQELEKELGLELFLRTPQGISLTAAGVEFLGHARQVVEQMALMEERYLSKKPSRRLCAISTQHYAFVVNAFVNLVKHASASEYEFTLRETRTAEILEDVRTLRSELGILYLSPFNRKVLLKILREGQLEFSPLFTAQPHVFVSSTNPLATRTRVSMSDLEPFPCLSFEQGINNSFYFSEELQSTTPHSRQIYVSDRATIFNLMIGLDGYTISTGIVSADLNGDNIIALPLDIDDEITVGWIKHSKAALSQMAELFLEELGLVLVGYGVM